MDKLKIVKATYYDPKIGVERGADVTEELSAEIVDEKLFYNGMYNLIFSDPFVGRRKKLRIEIECSGKKFTKFYNEDEKINLPNDLGRNISNKGHVAVKITESARNNVFINSHIRGGVEIAGQGNSFIETKINALKEEHPFWFWFGTVGTLIGIITGSMFLAQYFGVLPNSWSDNLPFVETNESMATTTLKVSDIFSRYNEMSRAIDQQNFLKNYIGLTVYGSGTFNNIAGSYGMDNTYYLYLNTPGAFVSCGFENTDEVTKRRLDLLRAGSRVSFLGTFTGSNLNGGNSWYIRDCSFAN